jgi:CheY-like chemotaxis protein
MSQLVDDLLNLARVGRQELRRKPIPLGGLVNEVVADLKRETEGRQVEWQIRQLPTVECDPGLMKQVFANLLSNAVKYTPKGGRIRVALRAEGNDAVFSVEDTGSGISATLLPFIFDMYVQADRTLDRAQGGLGIGLTLVRRLVELHGGTVVASSPGEGHGSKFTVRLQRIPSVTASPDVLPAPERRADPRRVLVIEDSDDSREMLRLMLELAGHVVYDAADGVRGLELIGAEHPDVAIIDIGLPTMDGYQVARRIREEPHGRGMLLLALTGSDAREIADPEYGFDYHLLKPVDPDQLARLLSEGAASSQGISP